MHKVPKSRYASVQQLSEDIRRHLEGLPVIARKAALRYRIGKFVGRQRTVLITGLIVLAFTGAAATAWQARTGREKPAGRVLKSMAVLPFVNVPADPSSEYFTDGITESIINSLSQLPDLRVIARTTAFRHKGRENEPQAVGRELAVDAVLTGTASQRDDSLTIQVDLVNVSDGSQLWGQRYKRKLVDILAVQEDVAESIVETLRLRLTSKIPKRVTKAYTENVEAYQLYLRGRYSCNMLSEEELHKGIHHLQQAIDLDPTYALAYSAAADCYDLLARYYFMPAYYPKARSAALRAIEIDGTLAEPHASLGYSMMLYDWDWHGAEKELKRALQLNPNYEVAHQWYGILLIVLGRFDQARSEMKRAQELDPLSFIINVHMGRAFYYSRQHDRAIEQLKKTLELYPHSVYSHSFYATLDLARAYEQSRMYNEAIDVLRRLQVPPSKSDKSQYDVDLAYAYAVTGRKRESMAILEHLISQPKENAPLVVLDIACIYAALGETDKAFEWIEKAYDEHLDRLIYIKAEPRYDPIRSDPRFANILRRMRLGP